MNHLIAGQMKKKSREEGDKRIGVFEVSLLIMTIFIILSAFILLFFV